MLKDDIWNINLYYLFTVFLIFFFVVILMVWLVGKCGCHGRSFSCILARGYFCPPQYTISLATSVVLRCLLTPLALFSDIVIAWSLQPLFHHPEFGFLTAPNILNSCCLSPPRAARPPTILYFTCHSLFNEKKNSLNPQVPAALLCYCVVLCQGSPSSQSMLPGGAAGLNQLEPRASSLTLSTSYLVSVERFNSLLQGLSRA